MRSYTQFVSTDGFERGDGLGGLILLQILLCLHHGGQSRLDVVVVGKLASQTCEHGCGLGHISGGCQNRRGERADVRVVRQRKALCNIVARVRLISKQAVIASLSRENSSGKILDSCRQQFGPSLLPGLPAGAYFSQIVLPKGLEQ